MFEKQLQPQVIGINPYVPGKPVDELERELGLKRISKLASNENPLGASLKVAIAIKNELSEISRYPDGSAFYLKTKLSEFLGISINKISVGNGSNELLELVARVFAGAGDDIIYSEHGFAVYPISTQAVGARSIEVPAKNWGHDLSAMLAAITSNTKIIYLANPNNPTGTLFLKSEWEAFISQVPKEVVVVLDEAYIEYVDHDEYANGVDYIEHYPNLLVSRTFSKAYGLASLRVGYMLGCEEITNYINMMRMPFNVNSFSQIAAVAALEDGFFVEKSVSENKKGMAILVSKFKELGLEYIPSYGNFICVAFPEHKISVEEINKKFLEQGVILRPVANYNMPQHLRVSIGSEQEIKHFLEVLVRLKPLYD